MKKALVTGASSGLGKYISIELSKKKIKVIGIARNKKKLETLKKIIGNKYFDYVIFDLKQIDEIEKISKIILMKEKFIDILINNAGITGPTTELWNYNNGDWKKIIEINLHGTFYCCKVIVPYMLKQKYGRIVNIASVSGKDGNVNASAYSSAKAGVIGLTKSLGKELATYNIAVNAVTPAGAKTRILNQMSKEHVQRMLSKVPRGRFLEVDELSSLICWLSSEENSFSTAAVFDISGGRSTY